MPRQRLHSLRGLDDQLGVIVIDLTTLPERLPATMPRRTSTSNCRYPTKLDLLGIGHLRYTEEQLAARLSIFKGCWVCGGAKQAIDHVKPLSLKGLDALCNIRPICRSCNASKARRWGPKLAAWLIKRRALCEVAAVIPLFK